MKYKFIFFLFIFPFCINAQDIEYAREVIKILSSEQFHGRGFTNNGEKIAAKYLKEELVKLNVKSFNNNYFQDFNISVNTIPSKINLIIDENELIPGEDYIISNSSGKCKGIFPIKKIDSTFFTNFVLKDYSKTFIVIDKNDFKSEDLKKGYKLIKYTNFVKARGIIDVVNSNTLQTQSKLANNWVNIQIKKEKFDSLSENITIKFKNKFYKKYQTQNVIGYVEGEVDTFILFGAHYDHLGNMGKRAYFPGANDNASGCAMVLNLAKHYVSSDFKPHYSMAFIFFSAEEVGILGSEYFSENPIIPLSKIKFFFNLDMVGTGEEGIKVVNGSVLKKEFEMLVNINEKNNYLKKVSPRGEAMNSDHHYIYQKGVKSVFIYTLGGYSEYHNIYDIESSLKLTKFESLFRLIRDFSDIYR